MSENVSAPLPRAYLRLLVGYLLSAFGDGVYLIAVN